MPQISLYIDKITLRKIERAAAKDQTSVSKWVGNHIKKIIRDDYPPGYFELFGSITDETFEEAPEGYFRDDMKRESL